MFPILFLHPQHRPWNGDYGAAADLDGDGIVEMGERERDLVLGYVRAAAEEGRRLGLDVRILDPSVDPVLPRTYDGMADVVSGLVQSLALTRALYVACHANAGGGDDALVGYDARSTVAGARAAACVAAALTPLPELDTVKTVAHRDDRHRRGQDGYWYTADGKRAWLYRGLACIGGIYRGPTCLAGVLCEPFFVDQVLHRPLTTPEGLRRVGVALATGAATYLRCP